MNNRNIILTFCLLLALPVFSKTKIKVKSTTPQAAYAASRLETLDTNLTITITTANVGKPEGFTISHKGKNITITGNDGPGCIYGANRLVELLREDSTLEGLTTLTEAPQMVMRGACVGLQKTEYLPGHRVYEYPYTPENFPWFYDKELWTRYLDMLASCNMNTVYLWNGHPFASLVRLKDYPFAPEVDEATMQLNQEMFGFLVDEADRRGIRIIQMFYNIILSKPFADHYGLKTQDRNRPITPLISDYTRKSIAAFVEKYPKVGFLVCLGEAMSGLDNDIKWMTETIIPGIRDGLKASGRSDTPPIILRNHDTDGPAVLKASLPLYPNIYTMNKYTGESLTTYQPGGSWGETHRKLAAAAPIHIDNVHILANLEPWRWSSPAFILKAVRAMHRVHHSKGLHLYPQASYWDWPYTADKLADGSRLLQIDRDWMWYKAWGRYAWNADSNSTVGSGSPASSVTASSVPTSSEAAYWQRELADYYGITEEVAGILLNAYDRVGEVAPKLLRRFGITEGNRQTLLLGMRMAQLVNPYKFNIYPGFYESCGPEGEKLIEYVEKEWKHLPHKGELPLDITTQCSVDAGNAAIYIEEVAHHVTRHREEFERLKNDIDCYWRFAMSFEWKVLAAEQVLYYKWSKDIRFLDLAEGFLQKSLDEWRKLVKLTQDTYLYANSMQTAQRRIPIGGDNGNYKTWADMLPVYEEELEALIENREKLKKPQAQTDVLILPAKPAEVKLLTLNKSLLTLCSAQPLRLSKNSQLSTLNSQLLTLKKGAILFENRTDTPVDSLAPELVGLQALVLNRDTTRIVGTTIEFECDKPVKVLVGFFQDDDHKWAKPPKLETDATGNEYGQAEPLLTNAIAIEQMPKVNLHADSLPAGRHTLRLPKGIILVAGFTSDNIKRRDCALNGPSTEVDWLFQK